MNSAVKYYVEGIKVSGMAMFFSNKKIKESPNNKIRASILRDNSTTDWVKPTKARTTTEVKKVSLGEHQWWQDYCPSHGETSFSTAWGSMCVLCAKQTS